MDVVVVVFVADVIFLVFHVYSYINFKCSYFFLLHTVPDSFNEMLSHAIKMIAMSIFIR